MSVSLQLALKFRKESDFSQALLYLTKACEEEKNPLALFYVADAYEYGGWGLERDFQKAFIYARRAHKAGCKYGTYMYGEKLESDILKDQGIKSPFIREYFDEITPEIQAEANNGDGMCQAFVSIKMVGNPKSAHMINASLKQCVHQAYIIAGLYHYTVNRSFKLGINYLKKIGEEAVVFESIRDSLDFKEFYALGWALATGLLKDDDYNTYNRFLTLYYNTYERVEQALSAWFIICKRGVFPGNKDLVRLIAKYILKYAEDPEEWGVVLDGE